MSATPAPGESPAPGPADAVPAGAPRSRARRAFLVGAAVLGGGLAVAAGYVGGRLSADRRFVLPAEGDASSFGAWLTIGRDGSVTVAVPNQEMGQGVMTTIPMLVAEELDAAPAQVRAVQAPVAAVYANPTMLLDGLPFRPDDDGLVASGTRWTMERILRMVGVQATGGSTSTRNAWMAARRAGAAARAMLVQAAARRLGVAADALDVRDGRVVARDGRSLGFGDLATEAAGLPLPARVALKQPGEFRLIGRGMERLDVPSKTDGSARFGIDVILPGMRLAAIAHSPRLGGRLAKAELAPEDASQVQLVTSPAFVAVIADGWWAARKALSRARIEWTQGPGADVSSDAIFARYAKALDSGQGATVRDYETRGDVDGELGRAARKLSAEYRVPFLAHATMEPMNCTAWVRDGRCEIWAGNQAPTLVRWLGAARAGVDTERTVVHTPLLGGGFGRRADIDFVLEAVEIAGAANGVPVKTIWSREEDMRHDVYRPAALARFEAGLDASGELRAWRNRIASPSVSKQFTRRLSPKMAGGMPDKTNAEGATWLPYGIPGLQVRHAEVDVEVPVGFWRSVGHSFNAFFVESFVDECAHAAGADPYEFRRRLLASRLAPESAGRFLKVLDAAARRAGWGRPLAAPEGVRAGRGIALAESFHSIVAQVAEVEVGPDKAIRVRRVVAAVDCGLAVDPAIVRAQIAGGVVFALSAALFGRIDVQDGAVQQTNFHDYSMIKLADAPDIDVEIIESDAPLGGIGEVGVPPLAPAVGNAIFAATGSRLRELPFSFSGMRTG